VLAVAAFPPILRAGPEDSVVKIYASIRFPNPSQPWMKGDPAQQFGSGVVIEGNRILTNAHLVEYATEVSVQAGPGAENVEAKIAALNYDVDLAVLTVKDEKYFQKRAPLPRSQRLPNLQNVVSLYGFPIGGEG